MQTQFDFNSNMQYVVWVGAVEVTPYLDDAPQAERIAEEWREDGYDDVCIQSIEGE
ncbi:MAG: hypothetical protein NZ811_00065 [Gammaproteobacteria bacterium]|jgi:hypothetical protein|nr:hypothetical protein [Gammaproteobacteria bacterium]